LSNTSRKLFNYNYIIALSNENTKRIGLFFTPQDTSSYEILSLEGEDVLFAMGKDLKLLKSNQFMFPKLSHT